MNYKKKKYDPAWLGQSNRILSVHKYYIEKLPVFCSLLVTKRFHVIWILDLYSELTANIQKGLEHHTIKQKAISDSEELECFFGQKPEKTSQRYIALGLKKPLQTLLDKYSTEMSCFYFFKLFLVPTQPNYSWKKQSDLFLLENKIGDTKWKQVKN